MPGPVEPELFGLGLGGTKGVGWVCDLRVLCLSHVDSCRRIPGAVGAGEGGLLGPAKPEFSGKGLGGTQGVG